MPQNLIAARPGCYGKFRDEAFAHLPKIGIRHLEINPPPEEEWPALRAHLDEHGLKLSSSAGRVDLADFASVKEFDLLARFAQAFGAKHIFLSAKTNGRPLAEAYAELRGLGDVAKRHGATIVLETHPDLCTHGDVAAQTMQGVNHSHVKLNFDTANVYYHNPPGLDCLTELRKFLPWLGAVHLKESDGQPKSWYFPGLGEGRGIVPFQDVFRICSEAGFYGPFTLEIEGIKGEALTKEQALARMEASAAHLRSIGAMP